ncbi:hypothetical protein [Dasania marina]|uniref:hypothetical protein n=1 Tax=Dasania marina TaxID=471499 RepID=UPI0030DC5E40|tara:strand:+ start:1403 stop:1591 length:189 start_codon:yes stop_codon:yes gene_type:complete
MNEQPIKVQIKTGDIAKGIDSEEDQRLREASWLLNTITAEVPNEYREAQLKFIGGQWIESVL